MHGFARRLIGSVIGRLGLVKKNSVMQHASQVYD